MLPLTMADRKYTGHSSGLPGTKVSGEGKAPANSKCGKAGPSETGSYLQLAKESMKAVQKMPSRKFNNEQCEYLAQKLEVVVHSASFFLEVSRTKCHASSSSMDIPRDVDIFGLLLALAKQIENFVQSCCDDAWIQAAMTLTNVSEYVSSIGFNLELCRVAFCKDCAVTGLTLDGVDDVNRGEVEIVDKKAIADVDGLLDKLILEMPSLSNENKDLAIYLLQRLRRVKSIPASALSGYSLVSANDEGFLGKLFKRVQQTTRLGTCGSGATVDKAMWLGTQVALKTFYGPENPQFMKEVDIIRGLCHPNITSMFCSAMDRRRCSIIMELMDEDLHALMHRRLDAYSASPPFPILEAVDIMLQIGEAVNYLHNKRIVHRDLKSMNILVKSVKGGNSEIGYVQVKVADFGLSKIKETNTRFSNQTLNTGTNKWMAPEIVHLVGRSQESHSGNVRMAKYPYKLDVYSFAMVCYEILTGNVPFPEISAPSRVKTKVLNGERPTLPKHCPYQLKALIEECWNQEPIKRPSFAIICKRLKYFKCLLMRSPYLTVEEPLQEEIEDMSIDATDKQSSMIDMASQISANVKLSLTMKLAEASLQGRVLDPEPLVYLCHCGAQMGFVQQLCIGFERVGLRPFFDKRRSSIPIRTSFPQNIFAAIKQCQVGVVVLSAEFFISKWPMLELVEMMKESQKPYSNFKFFPVFMISPEEVRDQVYRNYLVKLWEEWAVHDKRIHVHELMTARMVLLERNGIVYNHFEGHEYLKEEVIRATLNVTFSEYHPGGAGRSYIQGRSRLFEVLRERIYQQICNGVCVIGLYGTGGIGKTTICKVVCEEFFEEFLGRVCYADLNHGTEVEVLRHVLSTLTKISCKLLGDLNIDQYYDRLQRLIHRHTVFLVIDNVNEQPWSIKQAECYLRAEFSPGSVVILATRSFGMLQNLNIDAQNCIEMPKLEKEEARSLFMYHAAPEYNEVDEELLEQCMRIVKQTYSTVSDSNSYHYHPIALKEFAVKLGYRPEEWGKGLTLWTERWHKLDTPMFPRSSKGFDMLTPDSRPSFLRKSFDMLVREDQLLFMDAALYYPEPPEHGSTLKQLNIFEWLSLIHEISVDALMTRLEGLKSKLLLEHLGDGSKGIGMHPMSREFCESEANVGEPASRRWVYNDSKIFEEYVLPKHGGWESMRSICLKGSGFSNKLNLNYCTNVTLLKLVRCHVENRVLDLSPLIGLKSLEILSCTFSMSDSSPVEVLGLGLLRNLLVLKWDNMPRQSPCIEEIGLLANLRILELDSSDNENKLPHVGRLCSLREATFRFGNGAVTVSGLSLKMTSLRSLDLRGCYRLLSFPILGPLVALEELCLSDCLELEELPYLHGLRNLKKLDISGCRSIKALPDLVDLVALQELNLCDCTTLQESPILGKLENLRKLEMRNCFSIGALLDLGYLFALKELDLQGCSMLRQLPSLEKLRHLRKLNITDCCLIEAVPGLSHLISLQEFRADRCSGLLELPDLGKLKNLLVLNVNLER